MSAVRTLLPFAAVAQRCECQKTRWDDANIALLAGDTCYRTSVCQMFARNPMPETDADSVGLRFV
ncbi:MAG: hypothetical protein CBB97_03265 [Candidatus Endolissoclinum sp. TMED37]|nr:MAG: hypothetical protein CBB97_03265 [Candidatus Endolissoclinum sp. TMED37]